MNIFLFQRLTEEKELSQTGIQMIMGHHLRPQNPPIKRRSDQYCDKCAQIIWGVIHVSYICSSEYLCYLFFKKSYKP